MCHVRYLVYLIQISNRYAGQSAILREIWAFKSKDASPWDIKNQYEHLTFEHKNNKAYIELLYEAYNSLLDPVNKAECDGLSKLNNFYKTYPKSEDQFKEQSNTKRALANNACTSNKFQKSWYFLNQVLPIWINYDIVIWYIKIFIMKV